MRMWWSDSRLVFPAAFKNKDGGLLVKRKDIWWPSDVSLINGRGNVPLDGSDIFVRIYPNGKAYMSRMLNSQISCPMDAQEFPYDIQRCNFRIESWFHSDSWIGLRGVKSKPLLNPNTCRSEEFELRDLGILNGPKEYSGGLWYTSTTFVLQLRRYSNFYVNTLIIPSIMLLLIQLGGLFVAATAAPARVGINLTCLLTLGALRIPIANLLPVTNKTTWLGGFQSNVFIVSTLMAIEYMIVSYIGTFKDKPSPVIDITLTNIPSHRHLNLFAG